MSQRIHRLYAAGFHALLIVSCFGCATAERSSLPRARPIADGQFWVFDLANPGQIILPQPPPSPPVAAGKGEYTCIIDGGLPPAGSDVPAKIGAIFICKMDCVQKQDYTTRDGYLYHCTFDKMVSA